MRKTYITIICLFLSACGYQFDRLEFTNEVRDSFFSDYDVHNSKISKSAFGDTVIIPFLKYSDGENLGNYELRVSIWSKHPDTVAKIDEASIRGISKSLTNPIKISSIYKSEKSGLYFNHECLISNISGSIFDEMRRKNINVEVFLKVECNNSIKKISYNFRIKKTTYAAPYR